MTNRSADRTILKAALLTLALSLFFFLEPALAQSGLEGRITTTIYLLIRIVNILIVGFVVWAGFLIARGEGTGFQRLIYGVLGLIVANAAYMIINYFT
jgi:hypothetical protein